MSTAHLSTEQVDRFRRGTSAPNEVLIVGRHLADCDECSVRFGSPRSLHVLRDVLEGQPVLHVDVAKYAEDALPRSERDAAAAHLDTCPRCREDVEDLIVIRRDIARRRYAIVAAGVAAAVIAAVATVLFLLSRPESSRPLRVLPQRVAGYGRADWDAAVRVEHLAAPPVIATLRPSAEELRGNVPAPRRAPLDPVGVVVESVQPQFTWPAAKDAHYVVTVFSGTKIVSESGPLATNAWTPPESLARGVNYTWQVEVQRGDDIAILSTPPTRPAMFRVLDETTFRDIEEARRRFPDDHLLRGVLYARAGVQRRAEEELALSDRPAAQRLLADVRRW